MRRLIGLGLLLALFALSASLNVLAQEEKKKKGTTTEVDSADLKPGEYVGILKTVPGSDRVFSVEVQSTKYVPVKGKKISPRLLRSNSAVARNYNNAANRVSRLSSQLVQAQSARPKSAAATRSAASKINSLSSQLNNALVQLEVAALRAQAELARENIALAAAMPGSKAVASTRTIEFQAREDVKVRLRKLPEKFDEKGKPQKYTRAELDELKGKDKDLPGYESSLEKLEAGQKLRVVLAYALRKPADKDKDKESEKDKKDKDADKDKDKKDKDADKDKGKKDKDKEADKDGEKKMQVRLIVILEEVGDGAKDKKKE
jgi:hypothetical protein